MAAFAEVPRVGRKLRQPQHTFSVRHIPFMIQPFFIAPVLPGETMKNALVQVRAVSDPVKSPLTGWWLEHYLFYVKHRDMASADVYVNMMLDPSVTATTASTDNNSNYTKAGQPRYVAECLWAVVAAYFRDRGEAWDAHTISGVPSAKIQQESWMQSANTIALNTVGDFNVDANADSIIKASEVSAAYERWQFLRANNLTDASYEDYLRSFGVRVEPEETNYPELIRYSREWQYPSNTINPETGAPSSAVSFAISERADKDRFFREPGFIFGVTVARPKVYLSGQVSAGVTLLKDAYDWLPAILRDDPMTSVRQVTPAGMVPNVTAGQAVDVRDLFLYGDQFVNYDIGTLGDGSAVALPTGTNWRYPTVEMATGLFVNGAKIEMKQDGIVRLSVMGALVDHTPRGSIVGQTA